MRRFLAMLFIFYCRALRRVKMHLLRPAFKGYGRNFVFDPNGLYSYAMIEVGDDVFIGSGATLLASESAIVIGNKVMFGPNVTIVGGDHNSSVVGRFMYDVTEKRETDDQTVIIDDDVWIGTGVVILKGAHLGRGCIVAAGSVVTRDVPPYAIVAGVPAKVVRLRFDVDAILRHEAHLYPAAMRLTREQIAPDIHRHHLSD